MTDANGNIRDVARQHFASKPLGPDEKTRICLFLQSVKSTNAAILSKIEFQPFEWLPYKHMHTQYYKDIEQSTLLAKATEWSLNPILYMDATRINLNLWQKADVNRFMSGHFELDENLYEYLALSHAFMSEIRILSFLPPDYDLNDPFIHCLQEIDEENGRQIQIQVRMLKDMAIDISEEAKEKIVENARATVASSLDELLESIVK
ncbi:MAG: hypothetical protein K6L76_01900 [Agarilytica sp.]